MDFPFETTKSGHKVTVLGTMPDGRLCGFISLENRTFFSWDWEEDGACSCNEHTSLVLPLQVKPLTTYRMRNGQIAWTSRVCDGGWIAGMTEGGADESWRIQGGRWQSHNDSDFDLIEELPPGTTA